MKKTIRRLKRTFNIQKAVIIAVLLLSALLMFFFRVDKILIFIILAYAGVLLVFLTRRAYARNAAKRLTYLVATEMDPHLLQEEAREAYKGPGSRKALYGKLYYESAYYSLMGDYRQSLKVWEQIPFPKKYEKARLYGAILNLIRAGDIKKAEEYVQLLPAEEKEEKLFAARHRALGAYYVSVGDLDKARDFLEKGVKMAEYNSEKMGLSFDLARLEEKEGRIEKAIEYYKQAAALGPKAWMGQEAARRAEALAAGGI